MSQWIGRYELLKELDRGFLGTLWVARFEHEGKSLLALIRALQLQEQFGDEVRELIGEAAWDAMEVSSAGVAAPVDAVFEGESVALVYDFVEAQPLSVLSRLRAVQQISCPLPIALRVLCDLLEAAQGLAMHAAETGLEQVFGGLSPSSVMVATDGGTTLLDPLIGAIASQDERCREHADRVRYLAPEQFRNEAPTACSDVYAAGCILWELLANRRLHVVSPRRIRERVLAGDTLRLDAIARSGGRFDSRLVEVVATAMSVDPQQRYASPAEFERALRALEQPLADASAVREFIEGLASSHLRNQRKVTESSTVADLNSLLRSEGVNARRPRAQKEGAPNPLAARIQAARSERLATAKAPPASKSTAVTGKRAVASNPFRTVVPGAGAAKTAAGRSVAPRLHRGTLIGIPAPAGERAKASFARTASGAQSPPSKVAPTPVAAIGPSVPTRGRSSAASSPDAALPRADASAQPSVVVTRAQPSAAAPAQPFAAASAQPSATPSGFRDSMTTLVDDAPPVDAVDAVDPSGLSRTGAAGDVSVPLPTASEFVHQEDTSIIEPFNDGDRTEVDVPVGALREAISAPVSPTPPDASSELEEDSVGRVAMTSLPHVGWGAATTGAVRAEEAALWVNTNASSAMRRPAWPAVTWFFAGSTVTLLLVVLGLLGRSENPPVEAVAPTTNATVCAPAPSVAETASTLSKPSGPAQPTPAPSQAATNTSSTDQTTTQQEQSATTSSAPTTSVEPSAPKPAPRRRWAPRPRQTKPKPKPSSRFIPADL